MDKPDGLRVPDELPLADRIRGLYADLAEARREREAAERMADRLRHGEAIEGDFVCPDSLRADRAEAERAEARAALARLTGEEVREIRRLTREAASMRAELADALGSPSSTPWTLLVAAVQARETQIRTVRSDALKIVAERDEAQRALTAARREVERLTREIGTAPGRPCSNTNCGRPAAPGGCRICGACEMALLNRCTEAEARAERAEQRLAALAQTAHAIGASLAQEKSTCDVENRPSATGAAARARGALGCAALLAMLP